MSGRGGRGLGVSANSHVIRGSGGAGAPRGGGFPRNDRGSDRGGGRPRGGGRYRRQRFRSSRSSARGRTDSTGSQSYDNGPQTPDEWLVLLESEAPDAYFDFAIALVNTGIPHLEAVGAEIINLGWVAGQEFHAILVAACLSMRSGYVVHPDGATGRRISSNDIEEEVARLAARSAVG